MIAKCIVLMHITAEFKAYWLLLGSAVAEVIIIIQMSVCLFTTDLLDKSANLLSLQPYSSL